jgi:hypothetical protein
MSERDGLTISPAHCLRHAAALAAPPLNHDQQQLHARHCLFLRMSTASMSQSFKSQSLVVSFETGKK